MVRIRKLVVAIAAATALASEVAYALGLGEVTLQSALNQPLIAEIELLDTQGIAINDLRPALASADAFSKAGIDRSFFLTDLRFTPVSKGGRNVIQVTSAQAVREPYLNFLLEVRWPSGRLMREYTLLLDPPLYSPETVVAATPVQAPTVIRSTAPAAIPVIRELRSQSAPQSVVAQAPVKSPVAPTTAASSATEYRTTANDTLWVIANRYRQGGSVQQAMLAIQDLNPDAFLDGNINRMKSGHVLRLPTAEQVRSRTQSEAMTEVAAQGAQWRSATAKAAQRQLDATAQLEKASAPVKADMADSLRLVANAGEATTANEKGRSGENSSERLATLQENLDSSRRENQELNDRLQDLQAQVEKLQRLMSLKDAQLARLQSNMSEGETAEQSQQDSVPLAAGAESVAVDDVDAVGDKQVGEVVSEGGVEVAPVAAVVETEEAQTAVADNSPVSVDVAEAAVVEVDNSDSGFQAFLNSSLLLPVAAGTAVLLLGALLVARRRASKKAEEAYMLDDSLDRPIDLGVSPYASALGAVSAQASEALADPALFKEVVDTTTPVATPQAVAAPAADPMTESDIYIAYGRFEQAVDLLQSAINDNPDQNGLKLKLLEVYGEQGDKGAFQRQLQELRDAGVEADLIEDIEQRYPALVASTASVFDGIEYTPESTSIVQVAEEDVSLNLDLLDSELTLDLPAEDKSVEASNTFEAEGSQLDDLEAELAAFDLGLSEFELAEDKPVLSDQVEQNSATDNAAVEETDSLSLDELSLELDELALSDAQPVVELDASPSDVHDHVLFDLDDLEAQLGEVDLELDALGQALDNAAPVAPLNTPDLDLSELGDELDLIVDADENVTKLDLASAYIEMGDAEGARDILEEVLGSGSVSQKQEAQELLTQLS